MSIGILISLVVVVVVVVGSFSWYRRFIRNLRPDAEPRQVNGSRLTSECLHQLPTPPWRFVHEIAENRLSGIDHVIVGPSGIIAVTTSATDRPAPADAPDAHQVAAAAMLRADVDELAQRVGLRCDLLARVYWGVPQPDLEPSFTSMRGTVAVEGQRLTEWLSTLPPGPLTVTEIDLAWQAIVTGIGRPDPID